MTKVRIAIGVFWVLAFAAGRGTWPPAQPLAIAATSAEITAPAKSRAGTVANRPLVESHDREPAGSPRFDLFGNEVEPAIADYRIDLRGTVYERHSPDTAVPKLGSPKV